jgi:hypothetical protein
MTWLWWTLATASGGTLGEILLRWIEQALRGGQAGPTSTMIQIVSWTALGLVLGALQWLVLRRYVAGTRWWISATALAGAIAYPLFSWIGGLLGLGGGMGLLFTMLGLGFVFGVAQALVLQSRVGGGFLWVLASTLAWPFEHFLAISLRRATGGDGGSVDWTVFVGWAIYGLITGAVLTWLLRTRSRAP